MKKSLFALAALSAFATAAQAQSSVTLYGNLDATEAYQSAGAGKSLALTAAANSTSLWGMTGSEDMGGGMKMGFDLKSEINMATGATGSATNVPPTTVITQGSVNGQKIITQQNAIAASNLFNRGANIFISTASLGEVKIGRMDEIEWAMGGNFSTSNSNSFGSNQAKAQMANLANTGLGTCAAVATGNTTQGVNTGGVCGTMGYISDNFSYTGTSQAFMTGIQYTTPSFNGVSVKVQSGMGANSANDTLWAGNTQAASISYMGLGGDLNGAIAQARHFDGTGQLGLTITSVGLKYKATPVITLTGLWSQTGLSNATAAGVSAGSTTAASTNVGSFGANAGNTMWSVGLNYQVTPNADVSLAYTTITGDTAPTSTGTGVTAPTVSGNSDTSVAGQANAVTMWGLTGRYNLSKRTTLYAGAGVANNSGAYFMSPIYGGVSMATISAPSANGVAAGSPIINGNGASITAYMIGLKHSF